MPTTEWNVADAKSKLSEVLNRADQEAQVIKRRDHHYVLIRQDQYRKLTGEKPTLKSLILDGPSLEDVDLQRDRSPERELKL